ncbi:hypothetical protein KPA93_11435 [Burkholderia cenocepacia]|uniref:Uncharacterized protein n=3 Tax=Burkholderia cenocepacia TaxID=95486 RepID=A0AAD0IZ56_9BURK|nr:hypothetical protein B9Z07_04060 [Burkholderia cenocepacia]ELK7719930.1 hypothetical protein [Burkholderia cenocepacia]MBR8306106.1 hypothetical protein [Burkholderia cenocepacia]MDR8030764.1 hypothetical protein [Burkholderia cenocepacia]MDR8041096.1 hypothetical protein [Burkholderia cenocepacia]
MGRNPETGIHHDQTQLHLPRYGAGQNRASAAHAAALSAARRFMKTCRVSMAFPMPPILRPIRSVSRTTAGIAFVVSLLSGCAAMSSSAPVDPQQQFVAEQRNANERYYQTLAAYKPIFQNPGNYSRAEVLEKYDAVLYQYSLAAVSWVRTIYPAARQTLPPSLQPLPASSGPLSLADVNRRYEYALGMNAGMWEISMAADFGKPSKLAVPRYDGPLLFMPFAPPLPPLQDVRDPRFARLVTMTKKVDDAQKADLARQNAANARQMAENAAMHAANHPPGPNPLDSIDPRTGLPYPAPQQDTQRWCTMMGNGVGGRVPC